MKGNNKDSIKKIKRGEEDIRAIGTNNSRESEINRSNSLPEGINNTSLKYNWAEESQKASLMEHEEEDAKKERIIENLVRERERRETKLENKDKIIQNLVKGEQEEKRKDTNIEKSIDRRTQIRNIRTRVKEIKQQLDIKNKEIRDIYDELGGLLSDLENIEKPLEYNKTRENKFQKQAKHNKNTYKINSGNKETRSNNFQNSYKTYEGRNYNWRKQPCRLHGQGHTAQECMTACEFCHLKGSHKSEDCREKKQEINEFKYAVEKQRKYNNSNIRRTPIASTDSVTAISVNNNNI